MSDPSETTKNILEKFPKKITRQSALSFAVCAHCGLCTDSCHYYLATGEPKYAPAYKADRVRKLFKKHVDYNPIGKVLPEWIGAKSITSEKELEELKDVVFGSCTMCRRCTVNCPLGVDKALLIRTGRAMLTEAGLAPQGIRDVSKDQWEIGNQMGVTPEDYTETIDWLNEELQAATEDPNAVFPLDVENPEFVYVINPREVKYDPRPLIAAAKIMYAANAKWTLTSAGWDNTNFGLFSGDNALGGHMGKLVFENVMRLKAPKLVVSECGHGFRATKWESPNWAKAKLSQPINFEIESFLETMWRWVKEGRIKLNKQVNADPVTYHDPCNLGRSSGLTEEPRYLLQASCMEFREMYPNRENNFCCTGGGGSMSMSEYSKRRLESAKPKADQLKATGAKIVATACHNCIDGLSDLIKHYSVGMKVNTVGELVAKSLVISRPKIASKPKVAPTTGLKKRRVLVVDDEKDITTFLNTLLSDHDMEVFVCNDSTKALEMVDQTEPDLITLDVAMPGKTGIDVYRELRTGKPSHKAIPVVIVSGVNPRDYPQYDFRKIIYEKDLPKPEGFADKPVDEEQLILSVKKIFETTHKSN